MARRDRASGGSGRSGTAGIGTVGMGSVGWLFADMMIGLFIIALATQAASSSGSQQARPVSATSTPSQRIAPDARMEQAAITRTIEVDSQGLVRGSKPATRAARNAIRDAVADLAADRRRAALVLVWGSAPEVDLGMRIAEAAESQLDPASRAVFAGAISREFWRGGPTGKVVLEIYLFGQDR